MCNARFLFYFAQFSILSPLTLEKCFSLFVTKIEFIVKAVDAISKSKSSMIFPVLCEFAFNSLKISIIALSMFITGNNSFIRKTTAVFFRYFETFLRRKAILHK